MIREATTADTPRLVEMGECFLSNSVYAAFPINREQMAQTVELLLTSPIGRIYVAERNGDVVGMIGGLLFRHPISGEATVSELFWWVEPEHRGCGIRLLKRAEEWAVEVGAVRMHMVAPTAEVGQMYLRLGYSPLETTYQKALSCSPQEPLSPSPDWPAPAEV